MALNRGGKSMRLFPVGAKEAIHVPLSIVEDVDPESELELCVGAPEGLDGTLVIDMASWRSSAMASKQKLVVIGNGMAGCARGRRNFGARRRRSVRHYHVR